MLCLAFLASCRQQPRNNKNRNICVSGADINEAAVQINIFIQNRSNILQQIDTDSLELILSICKLKPVLILIIIIRRRSLFQEDNIFGKNASLTCGHQIQRHTCY